MAAGALVIIKRFTYRGDATEEYSNKYFYLGSDPADATAWRAFFDAVVLQEKTLYPAAVSVVGGYGYDSDSEDATAVWTVDLTVSPNVVVPGTLSTGAGVYSAGDDAVWIRWGTSRFNSKGKRIYLRKFFHPAASAAATGGDAVHGTWKTAANAYAAKWHSGTDFGNRTISAQGHDDTIVGHGVSDYITTRTLKRRGKRPGS